MMRGLVDHVHKAQPVGRPNLEALLAQIYAAVADLSRQMQEDIARLTAEDERLTACVSMYRASASYSNGVSDGGPLYGRAAKDAAYVVPHPALQEQPELPRSLLIAYYPREATEADIGEAFGTYGEVRDIYLVVKGGEPKCYGFVNFTTHEGAVQALEATQRGAIYFFDRRGLQWTVKAEWAKSSGSRHTARFVAPLV